MDFAIFLAALGITTLEFVEAAAVGLALYADSKRYAAFGYVALGSIAVLIPTLLLGGLIAFLPNQLVKLVGGVLMLYFGQRLIKSARRSVIYSRKKSTHTEHFEKGLMATGFSVGAIEAFEAAIVLVGLLPNDYNSTLLGMGIGIVAVVVSTYVLRNQVRKVKQANVKVVVSALLLSFAVFWFGEIFLSLSDLVLIPLFAGFALLVHTVANRPSPAESPTIGVKTESPAPVTNA
jgi:uncharacterized membrane protein